MYFLFIFFLVCLFIYEVIWIMILVIQDFEFVLFSVYSLVLREVEVVNNLASLLNFGFFQFFLVRSTDVCFYEVIVYKFFFGESVENYFYNKYLIVKIVIY